MTPKQIYARLEIIEKVLTSQQRHIAKHWTVEQMFDETFRSRVVHLKARIRQLRRVRRVDRIYPS